MGETVDQVILFDCPSPVMHDRIDEIDMLRGFFEDLNLGLALDAIDSTILQTQSEQERFANIVAIFNKSTQLSLDFKPLYEFYRVFKHVVNAVRAYSPGAATVSADLVVIRARDGQVTEFAGHPFSDSENWGWDSFTSGATHCIDLSGTHHTLLKHPHVGAVAEFLNRQEINFPNEKALLHVKSVDAMEAD